MWNMLILIVLKLVDWMIIFISVSKNIKFNDMIAIGILNENDVIMCITIIRIPIG